MKAYSKAAKLRAKKAMPALAPVPQREADGRTKRSLNPDHERSPDQVVLKARARHMGRKDYRDMAHPAYGEAAGQAIMASRDEGRAKELWEVYKTFTAVEAIYAKTYLGLRLHAKTAKVEYLIETFEARPDDRPDYRTEEERSKDASNRWAIWRGYLMCLPKPVQGFIKDAAYGRGEPMAGGKVTAFGRRFVAAVELLAKEVEIRERRK